MPRVPASSMSVRAAVESRSRSVSVGAARAATATRISRVLGRSRCSRSLTRPVTLGGNTIGPSVSSTSPSATARPSSRARNGFPPAARCSTTSCGRDRWTPSRSLSNRWVSSSGRARTVTSCRSGSAPIRSLGGSWTFPRTVSRIFTGSCSSRRSMNASTSADASSTHCMSSTAISSGRSRTSSRTADSKARPRTRESGGEPLGSRSTSAVSMARRCTVGIAPRATPSTGENRSPIAAKARCASGRAARAVRTTNPGHRRGEGPRSTAQSCQCRRRPPSTTNAGRPVPPRGMPPGPGSGHACRRIQRSWHSPGTAGDLIPRHRRSHGSPLRRSEGARQLAAASR
jgi:hypothetical protein